jgi:hypothetical protein
LLIANPTASVTSQAARSFLFPVRWIFSDDSGVSFSVIYSISE